MNKTIVVDGHALEAKWIGASESPSIVMLHEGLGSVSAWRDFPERLSQATGASVFAYSRAGYGASPPVSLPRPLDYLQREAMDVLPQLLEAIGFRRGVLLGHSDGASIAAIYAGNVRDPRVQGLVLIEPHFFVEAINLEAIRRTANEYRTSDLGQRLARHHANPDNAFEGWRDTWLDPKFEFDIRLDLAAIRAPLLVVKGENDPYSTMAQLHAVEEAANCPVQSIVVPDAGHAPHRDQPEITLSTIASFISNLSRNHGEAPASR